MLLVLAALIWISSSVFGSSCNGDTWTMNWLSANCDHSNGQYTLTCQNNFDIYDCGIRLDGLPHLGIGEYHAKIKASPGDGINTAFYLYSYGRNNNDNSPGAPWNEIDFEILGKQISGSQTRIWTNVWTGNGHQNGTFISVNWDASQEFHEYAIHITTVDIQWILDGSIVRTFGYSRFPDMVYTINDMDFQAHISLWGLVDQSWPDMGSLAHNFNTFPLHAYFKSITLDSYGIDIEPNNCDGVDIVIQNHADIQIYWVGIDIKNVCTFCGEIFSVSLKDSLHYSTEWMEPSEEVPYSGGGFYAWDIEYDNAFTVPISIHITNRNGATREMTNIITNLNGGEQFNYLDNFCESENNDKSEPRWTLCFSSDSYVITYPNFEKKPVANLNVYDKILTYDELKNVYFWDELLVKLHFEETEHMHDVMVPMRQFMFDNNETLSLTNNHLLYVDNSGLQRADTVKIGDKLKFFNGSYVYVVKIKENVMKYPRNLITYNTNVVINGVAISSWADTLWGEAKYWGEGLRSIIKYGHTYSIWRYSAYFAAKLWTDYARMDFKNRVYRYRVDNKIIRNTNKSNMFECVYLNV